MNTNATIVVMDTSNVVAEKQTNAWACHTVGLKTDGTVVAVCLNDEGQCGVSNWADIKLLTGTGFVKS